MGCSSWLQILVIMDYSEALNTDNLCFADINPFLIQVAAENYRTNLLNKNLQC